MTYDFAPLFRNAIGFDRLVRLVDTAAQSASVSAYPPYNIEKTGDDSYVLTMAVAGFGPDDIELTVQDNTLVVTGRVGGAEHGKREVLYRGIRRKGIRAPVRAGRPHPGRAGGPRERAAADRREARGAGGAEAAPDRDRRRRFRHHLAGRSGQ